MSKSEKTFYNLTELSEIASKAAKAINSVSERLEAIENHIGIAKEETKLEVGKWYKHQCGSIAYLGNEGTFSYGLSIYDSEGNMSDTLHWIDYEWDVKYSSKGWTKASPQEVEEALVKEAKRRGLVHGVRFVSPSGEDWGFKVTSNDFHFDAVNNTLSFTQDLGGTVFLFIHGHWAEPIIEQDKFAELKEAHRNGAVIQCKPKCTMNYNCWVDEHNPKWNTKFEYRIKPEEEPKVGDVCRFWDKQGSFVVGVMTGTYTNMGGKHYEDSHKIRWTNAKPLTKQEAIELLFGKGE